MQILLVLETVAKTCFFQKKILIIKTQILIRFKCGLTIFGRNAPTLQNQSAE